MMEKLKKDSPHQKLLQHGVSVLSDVELLAIVLCRGKTRTALALAEQLLTLFEDLPQLLAAERDDFQFQLECQSSGAARNVTPFQPEADLGACAIPVNFGKLGGPLCLGRPFW